MAQFVSRVRAQVVVSSGRSHDASQSALHRYLEPSDITVPHLDGVWTAVGSSPGMIMLAMVGDRRLGSLQGARQIEAERALGWSTKLRRLAASQYPGRLMGKDHLPHRLMDP